MVKIVKNAQQCAQADPPTLRSGGRFSFALGGLGSGFLVSLGRACGARVVFRLSVAVAVLFGGLAFASLLRCAGYWPCPSLMRFVGYASFSLGGRVL